MKTLKIVTAAVVVLGLSSGAYAGMGKCGAGKCGGAMPASGMNGKNFAQKKAMMLKRIDKMRACVSAAESGAELKACKQKMMQMRQQMMQNKPSGGMKCGAGKCGGR